VIADAVNYAIAGIGFIHAVGRLFIHRGFTASVVVRQNWTRRRSISRADCVRSDYVP
jgi:hypothetical protein